MSERPRIREFVAKSSLALTGFVGLTAINNIEVIDAVRVYNAYQEPAKGDIIPERHGCETLALDPQGIAGESRPVEDYAPAADLILADVGSRNSGVHAFGEDFKQDEDAPANLSPILTPFESYFDRVASRGRTALGANIEVLRNESGRAFSFDISALDQMTSLIFDDPSIYENPEVRAIVECKDREVVNRYYFDGKDVNIMVAPGEKTFIQNLNIGIYEGEVADHGHRAGFGTPNVSLNLVPTIDTPDHFMIITGINKDEAALNRLVLHEWIHVVMFQDLSDTLSEFDEQERFVKYVEKSVMAHIESNSLKLPGAITLLEGEAAPDLGKADSLQLKLGLYALYMIMASAAVGAALTCGKKPRQKSDEQKLALTWYPGRDSNPQPNG